MSIFNHQGHFVIFPEATFPTDTFPLPAVAVAPVEAVGWVEEFTAYQAAVPAPELDWAATRDALIEHAAGPFLMVTGVLEEGGDGLRQVAAMLGDPDSLEHWPEPRRLAYAYAPGGDDGLFLAGLWCPSGKADRAYFAVDGVKYGLREPGSLLSMMLALNESEVV